MTVLNQTPSAFRQLQAAEGSAGADPALALRWVIFGGEALELRGLVPWFERHGEARPALVNMYGITETTVHVTFRRIGEADARGGAGSVIGGAIADLSLHLLDRRGEPVPWGVVGELYVGGAGVSRGYHRRPSLTAARFVPDPWSGEPGSRLYRSGDLARRGPRGEVEYLGRIDHQVQLRGFRVELGEIESALVECGGMREAVVLARPGEGPEGNAELRLVAYGVPAPSADSADNADGADGTPAPSIEDLRRRLGRRLPDYMIPAAFVFLPALPLTAHGKVDRDALPEPGGERPELGGEYRAPASELERRLCALVGEALGVERVGVADDFFALGGDSIRAVVVSNRLQAALGEVVHVVVVFDAPTVGALAAYLEEHYAAAVARWLGAAVGGMEAAAGAADGGVRGAGGVGGVFCEVRRLGRAEVAQLRALVDPLPPRAVDDPPGKNRRAIFVLAPPRSGTTLLRVMLGGHPDLFAPPELELLSFNTLAERAAAFTGRDAFWLEGTTRAVMAARGWTAAEAEERLAGWAAAGWTTKRLYRELQGWLGGRLLVDKTPSYALDERVLARAEEDFAEPLYLHLVRHPYGMVRSFEEARLDQIFFRPRHPFTGRQLAELVWLVSQENILRFLDDVPARRRLRVGFEELVREPAATVEALCRFLGVEPHPGMLDPYAERAQRMTDGVKGASSRMLGDIKFHHHRGIDPAMAESWRDGLGEGFLGAPAWELAERLGYPREEPGGGAKERAVSGLAAVHDFAAAGGGPRGGRRRPGRRTRSRARVRRLPRRWPRLEPASRWSGSAGPTVARRCRCRSPRSGSGFSIAGTRAGRPTTCRWHCGWRDASTCGRWPWR